MKAFLNSLKKAFILTAVLLILCSVVYPLILTAAGQLIFPKQANGSLTEVNGQAVGSRLVGQNFTDPRFFRGRVSAVNYNTYTEADVTPDAEGNTAYGGVASGSYNYAPTNEALQARVEEDIQAFLAANPAVKREDIPADLLTASGSGLDPHISVQAAIIQIPAMAEASGLTEDELNEIVEKNTEHKVLGIFGEEKVNVLMANIEIAQAIGMF